MIKVNGIELDIAGTPLDAYLTTAGYDIRRVAVERNGTIVPRAQYGAIVLTEGDTLEIVSFVGGG